MTGDALPQKSRPRRGFRVLDNPHPTSRCREDSIPHTRGLFEMLAMPFGLCNSQATFQRLMDQALDGVTNAESCVDDILIYSQTFTEHREHLTQVLERLDKVGHQLRRDKCRLGYDSVEFLGHWISSTGRH